MKGQQDYEIDIRNNKIKQGFLIKRSRILKQWKQRWMVLTRTHLYSFVQKQVYKKPTQKIPLKEVSTIKSYYKNQYNRPQVIRIESQDTQFYLSAKNHQQKWAWMTAIQKMTDLMVCPQQQSSQSQNLIRQTLRMTTAIRNTINMKNEKKQSMQNNNITSNMNEKELMKKLKLYINSSTLNWTVIPSAQYKQVSKKIQTEDMNIKCQVIEQDKNKKEQKQQVKIIQKQEVKIIQKIVYVPQVKQKIVYVPEIKQKIVYVPQIKQVIKTVYVQNNQNGQSSKNQKVFNKNQTQQKVKSKSNKSTQSLEGSEVILQLFEHVMQMKCQVISILNLGMIYDNNKNPKPLIQFVVFLMFSQPQRYTQLVLRFATSNNVQQAFSNAFLQVLNEQIQQVKLNSYLQFIMVLYENNYQYFYINDLKLLIQILIRQIQMNRSYLNQYLIIGVVNKMADKKWWNQIKHRREQLITVVNDVKSWTNDSQTRFAAEQLLSKL